MLKQLNNVKNRNGHINMKESIVALEPKVPVFEPWAMLRT